MTFTTLISASELAPHINNVNWVVCDCRHELTDYEAGRRAYAEAHIPGAQFFDINHIADETNPKDHAFPDADRFAKRVGARILLKPRLSSVLRRHVRSDLFE